MYLMAAPVVVEESYLIEHGPRLSNSVILKNLKGKLSWRARGNRVAAVELSKVLSDMPGITMCSSHDWMLETGGHNTHTG